MSRVAQPHCLFEHRVEHRGEVTGRGIDDLQWNRTSGAGPEAQESRYRIWYAAERRDAKELAIVGTQRAVRRAAQPLCLLEHRVEHRGKVAGRRIDNLEHLGGRSLLFQRL